jgi:signal transduction histidine kinase
MMRFPWPRTLGAQLVAVTVAAVLISNVGVAVWFESTREKFTESAVNERLLDRAVSVATLLGAIPAKSRDAAAKALSSGPWRFTLHHGKAVSGGAMDEEEAQLAARARAMLPANKAKGPVLVNIRAPDGSELARSRRRGSGALVDITLPVVRGTQLEMAYVRALPPAWPMQLVIAALVAIVTGSAAAAFIARRVARPLSQLAASASEAARGGSAAHVPEVGPEDVRRAAHAFNAMTDQVTRTLESQRQLLSAVGHDLRTPITAMRISAEFIEDAELRERFQKNLEELQQLTEAVLTAARGAGWEQKRKIDLAALVESICTDLEEMEKPVDWAVHAPAPFTGRSNEIRRAVRNLVENAIAYGKRAHVRLADSAAAYDVIVEDEGPGIPESDRTRVFEPFVRLETSRSPETGGSGLGLTLVKAIAEGHGGSITLENRAEGGLRATLHLPREAATA